jgi:hypothetical protein
VFAFLDDTDPREFDGADPDQDFGTNVWGAEAALARVLRATKALDRRQTDQRFDGRRYCGTPRDAPALES